MLSFVYEMGISEGFEWQSYEGINRNPNLISGAEWNKNYVLQGVVEAERGPPARRGHGHLD